MKRRFYADLSLRRLWRQCCRDRGRKNQLHRQEIPPEALSLAHRLSGWSRRVSGETNVRATSTTCALESCLRNAAKGFFRRCFFIDHLFLCCFFTVSASRVLIIVFYLLIDKKNLNLLRSNCLITFFCLTRWQSCCKTEPLAT